MKTPNTKFIGCRFDECKFIRTDLRGETDQKFVTSKFVNKNEFKDTQGVSTSGHILRLVCSRLEEQLHLIRVGWPSLTDQINKFRSISTLDILCVDTLTNCPNFRSQS